MGPGLSLLFPYGKHDESDLDLNGFYKPETLFLFHAGRLTVVISNHPFEFNSSPLCDLRIFKSV